MDLKQISIELHIHPRLENFDSNIIMIELPLDSTVKNMFETMCVRGGEDFERRFYENGKCKARVFLNEKLVNENTTIKDGDRIVLAPFIGGG